MRISERLSDIKAMLCNNGLRAATYLIEHFCFDPIAPNM